MERHAVTIGRTPPKAQYHGNRDDSHSCQPRSGGRIRNSEGGVNEKEILWKRARWVDYSGAIENGVIEGITLFDHPSNPNHPSYFHVRNDGWMGASLTFDGPREITPDKPLRVRYGLYLHSEMKPPAEIDSRWKRFAEIP